MSMILNPYRYGGASVSVVAAAGSNYITSGTSINSPSTPSGIANGDGLYAILFARSTLTPPAGWTIVDSQALLGATGQVLYLYKKTTVTSSDASTAFTWSQSVAGRMGLSYLVARSSSGTITVASPTGKTTTTVASGTSQNVTAPSLTATVSGELFILAVSAQIGDATPNTNTWTAPAGATMRTTATASDNRLGFATQQRNAGQSNSSPFVYTLAGSAANEFAAITIRLQP